jgi:hypothetical protein
MHHNLPPLQKNGKDDGQSIKSTALNFPEVSSLLAKIREQVKTYSELAK